MAAINKHQNIFLYVFVFLNFNRSKIEVRQKQANKKKIINKLYSIACTFSKKNSLVKNRHFCNNLQRKVKGLSIKLGRQVNLKYMFKSRQQSNINDSTIHKIKISQDDGTPEH